MSAPKIAPHRVMPEATKLGQGYAGAMISAMRFREKDDRFPNPRGLRTVMGFLLPEWQRPFVWTTAQCVRFMESAWKGLPLGTYSINMRVGSRFDGYLIDGQQRMRALERYLDDEFPVFGYRWSEVTEVDRRFFEMSILWPYYETNSGDEECLRSYYETNSGDEECLRSYYDLMNFGGTPHDPSQRASDHRFTGET